MLCKHTENVLELVNGISGLEIRKLIGVDNTSGIEDE